MSSLNLNPRLRVLGVGPQADVLQPILSADDDTEHVHRNPRSRPAVLALRFEQVPFLARFAVINLVGVALLAAAWAEGLLLKPYRADESGMCYVLTILFVVGLVAVSRKDWQTVRWIGNTLVYLGMVGTVLGLIMTVSNLSVDAAQSFESFKAIITAIYVGAGIALYTNLLACIGYLWLGTNAHLLARQEV
jgi:hypothetical protein